jgi:predicted Zn-dependent protease with MMP-like domain
VRQTASSEGPPAGRERDEPVGTARRGQRDRRPAEREACRALSTRRAIAAWAAWIAFGHVCAFALLAGNGRLVLFAGMLALVAFVAFCSHVEPLPERGAKGEVATMSDAEFERLVASVERQASTTASAAGRGSPAVARDGDGFERLVLEAIDELPEHLRAELLRNVAVLVSDDGGSHGTHGCYGLYMGGTVADRAHAHRIVIFRDTLVRDFGRDPDVLRRQVARVVRHELAHHLGAGEGHVARLGLSDSRLPPSGARFGPWLDRMHLAHRVAYGAPASREVDAGPSHVGVTVIVRAYGRPHAALPAVARGR